MSEPGIVIPFELDEYSVPIWHKPVLTAREVAALIGCHKNTVYRLIKREGLPALTLYRGANYLIRRADLDAWLNKRANMNAA